MPKFLILRFSSIGDIVLTTPVIRCLKAQLPDAEVHYLTRKSFAPVLENNPYIDSLHLFDESPFECHDKLNDGAFEAVIDLHHNQRTFFVKRWLKKPRLGIFSFKKLNVEKWLLVNFKIDRMPDVHIVDRYMQTVSSLGVKNDGKGLDYFITDKDRTILNKIPATHRSDYVAVAIGAQHTTKRLPTDKLIGICKEIKRPVLLLGGNGDLAASKEIERESGNHVRSLCGELSLNESAAVVEGARVVLTHDTGLMHIASAFKKPIVSVWGNTVPQFGMTPYYGSASVTNRIFEVSGLSCRPCTKIGFDNCPKGHFNCMGKQDSDSIINTVNTLK
ncbi:MAG: glycosyltransferase family 9 protein [Bacteroidota bacterium]